MSKIDFVVTWVDGNDPQWLKERAQYMRQEDTASNSSSRFRDWGLMKYWFRGIEKFAPWVNKIYFVTCGHYPEWLNLDHPQLVHIKHTDYIPPECLPTYNSNVIELYMHKIPGLGEQFVLFNDDMFLLDHVGETDFFQGGIPCDTALPGMVSCRNPEETFPHTLLNNTAVINKYFSKKEVMRKYWRKFFSLKYGESLRRSVCMLPFPRFSAFIDTHLPASHLKRTFEEVWEKEPELLAENGRHRFRCREDLSHWMLKNWRFCQGQFVPRSIKWGKFFLVGSDNAIKAIENQSYKAICLNDTSSGFEFKETKKKLIAAFEKILPEISSFEKQG